MFRQKFIGKNKITIINREQLLINGDLSAENKRFIIEKNITDVGIVKLSNFFNEPTVLIAAGEILDITESNNLFFCEDDIDNGYIEATYDENYANVIKAVIGSKLAAAVKAKAAAEEEIASIIKMGII